VLNSLLFMKKRLHPMIYPFILLSVLVTVVLQLAWLYQLYQAQQLRVKEQLELTVRDAAQRHMYQSVRKNINTSESFREFFGSPEWVQLRQSFDDMKVNALHSGFNYGFTNDSVKVSMYFAFPIHPGKQKTAIGRGAFNHESPKELKFIEQSAITAINKDLDSALRAINLRNSYVFRIYDYGDSHLVAGPKPDGVVKDFVSKKYSFNLKHLHRYQLLVPHISATVLYSMRYYLISSFMMLVLTLAAFYVLLRLMRNQRLYADARQAFTSNMTHELKTPVATVAVALESIEKYGLINDPEKLRNYLRISRNELHRLNIMIEKVLSLETDENRAMEQQTALFDVQQILEEVIAAMQLQFANSGGRINYAGSEEPCFIQGDPVQLSHVFYNLMDNALKYAGPAPVLEIRSVYEKDSVVLSFSDQGRGIPTAYQHKVFDRFFRVPVKGETHDIKGSGLGLNYVQQIVQQHGGTVTLKSEQGKGCIFVLNLPADAL